jgi:hypothetical protein
MKWVSISYIWRDKCEDNRHISAAFNAKNYMPFKLIFHVTKPALILLILAVIISYRPGKRTSLGGRVAGRVQFILNNTSHKLKYYTNSVAE